jgi:hypothetical protein
MSALIQNVLAWAFALLLIGGPIVCVFGAHPPRWAFLVYLIVLAFVVYGHKVTEGSPS